MGGFIRRRFNEFYFRMDYELILRNSCGFMLSVVVNFFVKEFIGRGNCLYGVLFC